MTTRKRKLKELFFNSPKFHDGLNVTIRDGDKWLKELGNDVILKDVDGGAIGFASITGVLSSPIGEVPDTLLKLEHDKDCTTMRGIWRELESVYNKAFSFYDKVTVVFFKVRDGEF